MKNSIFTIFTLFLICCKPNVERTKVYSNDSISILKKEIAQKDSINDDCFTKYKGVLSQLDSIKNAPKPNNEIILKQVLKSSDSLKKSNHEFATKLLHSNLIITNAKYYLNIVNRNPSQQKFLRGWMNRALNQEQQK